MTNLFLSHASEDKIFVENLYNKLNKKYEVWFDKFSLTIGDSLFQSINRGLSECDFGVVVISPNFFEKQWTNDELGGLFSLETQHRKVILPIWHNVTRDDVKKHYPILADKLASLSINGLDRVAEDIDIAIRVYLQQKTFSRTEIAKKQLLEKDNKISEVNFHNNFVQNKDARRFVFESLEKSFEKLEQVLSDFNSSSTNIKFRFERKTAYEGRYFNVCCPYGIRVISFFEAEKPYTNEIELYIVVDQLHGRQRYGEHKKLLEIDLKAFIPSKDKLYFQNEEESISIADLPEYLFSLASKYVSTS